ncbi:MAG: ATP-binding protein, partial [Candidatus Thiodiazotropha sp.]
KNDAELPKSGQRGASVILRSGEHLADVIEGLLEISKIEARRIDLHRDPVSPRALIDQLVEMFSIQARAKNLEFRYTCHSELPNYVLTDEKRLRQILMNLLSNAVKFTQEGWVSLQVSYRNEVAKFVVSDSGIGIDPEHQERIYSPFERIRDKETQLISGTGLGLTISRLLSNLMGGDIALQSEPGKGSTFTFTMMLPIVRNPQTPLPSPERITGYAGPRLKVLVVDDEPMHRALVSDFLMPLGFEVLEAHNAAFALQLTDETVFDLYLLDVSMPVSDGWELAGQLRGRGVTAPIIMISGNAIENHREELNRSLHDAYLIKPIRLENLLEKIGAALGLQWTHEPLKPTRPMPEALPISADRIELPDHADLDKLVSLAKIGYLSGVMESLEQLEHSNIDPRLLTHLKSRAEQCDFEGLIQTVKGLTPQDAG